MIKKILEWALSKFEDKTPKIEAWPFPVEQAPKAKRKPTLKKATTKPAVKKPVLNKTVKKVK